MQGERPKVPNGSANGVANGKSSHANGVTNGTKAAPEEEHDVEADPEQSFRIGSSRRFGVSKRSGKGSSKQMRDVYDDEVWPHDCICLG